MGGWTDQASTYLASWPSRRGRPVSRPSRAAAALFDLRRVAVVHNLHVIARQAVTDSYKLAA